MDLDDIPLLHGLPNGDKLPNFFKEHLLYITSKDDGGVRWTFTKSSDDPQSQILDNQIDNVRQEKRQKEREEKKQKGKVNNLYSNLPPISPLPTPVLKNNKIKFKTKLIKAEEAKLLKKLKENERKEKHKKS